jgi:gamma-glutamyl phosphate reductase
MVTNFPLKDDVAQRLADAHYALEAGISDIYRVTAPIGEELPNEPIKLLEVNRQTVPMGVVPVYFGPGENVPYPSVIIDITPQEFAALNRRELSLPNGWRISARLDSRPDNN